MYTEEMKIDLLARTEKILKTDIETLKSTDEIKEIASELKDIIRFHDYRYYVVAEPLITDFEYDKLYKKLQHIEKEYPEFADPDSPTQRVAEGLTKEFPQVEHIEPMLSLDNSYNETDLLDFDRRAKELAGGEEFIYVVEPKYDGASISLVYENDILLRAVTRGDGVVGEEITNNIKTLRSVPLKAAFSKYGIRTIEIRGEVLIRKTVFKEINKKREEEGLSLLANPRNSAAGSLRMQDAAEVAKRGLEAVLYHVSYAVDAKGDNLLGNKLKSRRENIKMLHDLGFKAPLTEQKTVPDIKGVIAYIEEWAIKREEYLFEIDGMVVKVDNIKLEDKLGATAHHPRWAMAYKFRARQARTKLLRVDFQVGRIGTITPVAKLEPVSVGGVTVSSISMFNEDFINEKDIKIGDEVMIERAGDVIPYIAIVVKDARKGNEQKIHFPTHCPSCGTILTRTEDEAAWRCMNLACPAQVWERLIHFASKDAMDINGFGPANIEKFIKNGWLKSIPDIYRLPYADIEKLEGLGEKSVQKLKDGIEESKSRSLARLIFGLGIRHVGESTAKALAEEIHCVEDFKDWDLEKLSGLYDVGPKVAQSIYDFFHNEDNLNLIEELKKEGVKTCRAHGEEKKKEGKLSGLTFLFTGTMPNLGRDEAKEMAEAEGAHVANAISAKINYLVVGENPGSKVDKAKKLATVKIIDEDTFLEMMKG